MASYQWIKLYDEILEDPKMGRLSDGAYRFCINLFLLASRQDARDGSLPDIADIIWVLRLNEQSAMSHLEELKRAGIVVSEDCGLFIPRFATRQRAIDVNERMKQYRDRKRKDATPDVTDSDVVGYEDVTKGNTDKNREEKKRGRKETPPAVWNMITAISAICAQTYSQSSNHQDFEDAAYGLIGVDITPDDVALFGEWWGRGNGFHHDKPFIKNILSQIKSAKGNGWKDAPNSNGKVNGTFPQAAWDKVCQAVSRQVYTDLTDQEKSAIKAVGLTNIRMRDNFTETKVKTAFYEAMKQ